MAARAWRGECHVAPLWIAFRGRAADNRPHAHAALQVCMSLADTLCVRDAYDRQVRGRAIVIRPGARHQLDPSGDVAIVLSEPQSPLSRGIVEAAAPGAVVEVSPSTLASLSPRGPLERLCGNPERAQPGSLDPRLAQALAFLADAPLRNAVSRAAAHCGLSPARLRAVSTQHLGVPLSKWALWQSLRRAAVALRVGSSLAASAGAGGFADQAHFTRALVNTIGLTPGELRRALRGSPRASACATGA